MNQPPETPSDREKMLESLWDDARREGSQMVKEAQREARRLVAEAHSIREEIIREALQETRAAVAPEMARTGYRAMLEAAALKLEAESSAVATCFDAARRMVARDQAVQARIRDALPTLTEPALAAAGAADAVMEVAAADLPEAKRIAASHSDRCRVVATDAVVGGAIVTSSDGSRLADNTVTARINRMEEAPPLELFAILFGGG